MHYQQTKDQHQQQQRKTSANAHSALKGRARNIMSTYIIKITITTSTRSSEINIAPDINNHTRYKDQQDKVNFAVSEREDRVQNRYNNVNEDGRL